MFDPRIYRAGLLVLVLVTIVLAFSLESQQSPAGASVPPEAFDGSGAYAP